jgi:predicted phosphodiesterase
MKIGILADIHEHLVHLRAAHKAFQECRVDKILVLGDLFNSGERIQETINILSEAGAVGVWGNHDLGLCHEPDEDLIQRYGAKIVEFFASLTPHYELGDLLFSHGLPNWDATDPTIYYVGERPWEPNSLLPAFSTLAHRVIFIGHFHRWFLATSDGPVEWDGTQAIYLDPAKRHFLIVHAVLDGWCADFDTETNEFRPCFIG